MQVNPEKTYLPVEKLAWSNAGFAEQIDILLQNFVELTLCSRFLDNNSRNLIRETNAVSRLFLQGKLSGK